ncbi:uncharacterized protein LOC103712289 [Phoenix dactylifera]|uniref:Uncharacterized protein LOC103712289 n=1 Tax=Phoenix dactylifera TaxID=42345 RepID=A0A8B7CDI8_PHODC|nr:uncharacterized protein LOC103712289 [Phoenix dactylifera]
MSKGSSVTSRFGRCLRAPLRVLRRARDMYVRSLTECAGGVQYGAAVGYPTFASVPRSYSFGSARTSSSDEDLRELIRAASQSRAGSLNARAGVVVPRSQSVAVGRIEEDKPCDFDDDVRVGSDLLFPRSRSCAVGAKRRPRWFA